MHHTLRERLSEQPYQGYAYAYPHKTAYRHFERPIPLQELWAEEDRSALFLYVHLPFCEMRCGFCNLFTTTNPALDNVSRYLHALETQMQVTAEALGQPFKFGRAAFGGGTPSFLNSDELDRMFEQIRTILGADLHRFPSSFELSPGTTEPEKLQLLRARGVSRISVGIQSFLLEETKALGRPQKPEIAHQALQQMRVADFPVMNLDLIYGIPGQTVQSWINSLQAALHYAPEEIFLYPLYIRPLTGLERLGREPGDNRLELYRTGRDLLLGNGYRQISMRLFRRADVSSASSDGQNYCCQEDGMLGLGAGARSYTRNVHYSSEYAVGRSGIDAIIEEFSNRGRVEHGSAVYGCHLSSEEERRRYLIKSLLRAEGLSIGSYVRRFGSDPFDDFPELAELLEVHAAELREGSLMLTAFGLERSDAIGPWLFSTTMGERMAGYQLA